MRIKNTKPRLISVGNVKFLPGYNNIENMDYLKNNPFFSKYCNEGILIVTKENFTENHVDLVDIDDEKSKSIDIDDEKSKSIVNDKPGLLGFSKSDALRLIESTDDIKTLQGFLEHETRKTVRSIIEAKLVGIE